jgi:hypothetical protein
VGLAPTGKAPPCHGARGKPTILESAANTYAADVTPLGANQEGLCLTRDRPGPEPGQQHLGHPIGNLIKGHVAPSQTATLDHERPSMHMRGRDRDDAVSRRWPQKPAALQPLGIERHANAVVPQNFD